MQLRSFFPYAKACRSREAQDGSHLFRRVLDRDSDVRYSCPSIAASTHCTSLLPHCTKQQSTLLPALHPAPLFPLQERPGPAQVTCDRGNIYNFSYFLQLESALMSGYFHQKGKAKGTLSPFSPQKCQYSNINQLQDDSLKSSLHSCIINFIPGIPV